MELSQKQNSGRKRKTKRKKEILNGERRKYLKVGVLWRRKRNVNMKEEEVNVAVEVEIYPTETPTR